mmetsp:Transcript_12600/g.29827  ORF Transcript_12600/g.29827 Transcript_12600/m.29827 type:complete len:197 (-) Transcript_12600:273-863(-)
MPKTSNSAGIEMTGEIAMAERSSRRNTRTIQIHDGTSESNHRLTNVVGPSGKSVDLSVASSLYGGGVTITGGGPDETFTDEFGNECSRYSNRTIIVNEHMASADETRNLNGPDVMTSKGGGHGGMTWQKRMIAFVFVAATIVLLLFVLLDVGAGSNGESGNKDDKLAAVMGYSTGDDWDDDDDAWDTYTKSALGDD